MKIRSAPLDDVHLELLVVLDEIDRPWAHRLRVAANAAYEIYRGSLLFLLRYLNRRAR
jgi:hypothetical protein